MTKNQPGQHFGTVAYRQDISCRQSPLRPSCFFTTNTDMSIVEDTLVISGRWSACNSQPTTAGTLGYISLLPPSPEVDGGAFDEGAIKTQDGFYRFKKDSQKRQPLTSSTPSTHPSHLAARAIPASFIIKSVIFDY